MQWWRDARFGMFIHWGLYAAAAGVWKGEEIPGIGEWIMFRARIPVAEYEQLARRFNPTKFDAEQWVGLAEAAGQKYITITAKHHDGFAMYHSKVSPYNVVDATPWGRDPMKDLAEACASRGIRLCFYYSQSQDWHHPGGVGNDWDFDTGTKDFQAYLDELVRPQVTELLTQYGPIGLIWFDTPKTIAREQSRGLADLVHELQPECLVSGRIGNDAGDYGEMGDNKIPDEAVAGDWEVPATINDTWGFKTKDHNWKPIEDLVFKLVDIVSKGGNYLLNVGPTAEGVIPEPSAERLRGVGKWLRANGQAVYGCGRTVLPDLPHGCTSKPGKLFVHLFDWPGRSVEIPGLCKKVAAAYMLADPNREALAVVQEGDKVTVTLPAEPPDAIDSVLALEIEGETD